MADVVPIQRSPTITLPDGATARLAGDALELSDASGRLLVRYANGSAEIAAPSGDLTLSAPSGKVRLVSGLDVEIEAARDLTQRAARRVTLGAGEGSEVTLDALGARLATGDLEIEAKKSRLVTGHATLVARKVATTAKEIVQTADRYELVATRLVEKTRDAFRDVADLAQTRIGRARTIVREAYSLHARRTVIASKDETKVDGKKVLIG